MKKSFLIPAFLLLGSSVANATAIINNSGLSSPETLITFSEIVFPSETPITNEYSSYGVTFSPVAYYDPQPGFFSTASLGNFDFSNPQNISDPLSVFFNDDVKDVAVEVQTNLGTSTFSALLDGVLVESFSATTDDIAGVFYGFTDITFDQLIIDPNTFALIDNLQFNAAAVPEPSTIALLGLGLAGLGFSRRKKLG